MPYQFTAKKFLTPAPPGGSYEVPRFGAKMGGKIRKKIRLEILMDLDICFFRLNDGLSMA